MRNGIILLAFVLLFSACAKEQKYQLTGTFNGPVEDEWIYLGKFMDNEMKLDSARIDNGQFIFKGTVDFPEVYGLSFHPRTSPQIAPLFLESGSLEITIDLQNWYSGSIINGGKVNSEYQEFNRIQGEKVTNILLAHTFFGIEGAELGEILKSFLKVKPNRTEIEGFKATLVQLLDRINQSESEEFHKNLISDFLKDTYYKQNHFINTKGRNDLVIHNGDKAVLIVESSPK